MEGGDLHTLSRHELQSGGNFILNFARGLGTMFGLGAAKEGDLRALQEDVMRQMSDPVQRQMVMQRGGFWPLIAALAAPVIGKLIGGG